MDNVEEDKNSSKSRMSDVGYMVWKNDISWMESQRGERWESLIKRENARFKAALKGLTINFMGIDQKDIPYILYGFTLEADPFSPQVTWTHKESGFKCKCWDADFSDGLFVAAVQDGGYERFTVEVFSLNTNATANAKPIHLKTILNTGPTVAIYKGIVYYTGSEKDLRYSSVCKWSPDGSYEVLYISENLEENLELRRGEDGSVYIIRGDFKRKWYSLISDIKWIRRPHLESCIVSDNLILPGINLKDGSIESFSLKAGWTVTIERGIQTLWKGNKPEVWIWGDVSYDSRNPFRLEVSDIRYESYTIYLPEWKLTNPTPVPFPCSYYEHPLPAFVVHPLTSIRPRGLLITAYGAYGTPTHVGSLIKRWKPLLSKGWIIASVSVPGSGDHDRAWKLAGQRQNRLVSIEALISSIKSMQEEFGILPSKTALYGRSAGGLLVTSAAIREGGLVGALYLESPYIDVLRTISNPSLPLTTLETSEFGTSVNPTNLITTGEWSPLEHIPGAGLPGLFVIARTDLEDLEVLPYEVLKFIKRARGHGHGYEKLVYIHKGLGHFTTTYKSRAEDLALLNSWLESDVRKNNLGIKYKIMALSRKNRNMTRKNRKDRKDRKDRKNRKNAMSRKNRANRK